MGPNQRVRVIIKVKYCKLLNQCDPLPAQKANAAEKHNAVVGTETATL